MPGITFNYHRPSGLSSKQWTELASFAYDAVCEETPVHTGNLVSNWSEPSVTQRALHMDNPTDYASYVHDGRIQKNPYSAKQKRNLNFTGRAKDTLSALAGNL